MKVFDEVAPGIYQIRQVLTVRHVKTKASVSVYIIPGKDGLVFDAGYGRPEAIRQLDQGIRQVLEHERSLGRPGRITRAMISHGHVDHFSGLGFLKETFGLKVLATQKLASKIRSKKTYKKRHLTPVKKSAAGPFAKAMATAAKHFFLETFVFFTRMTFYTGPVTIVPEKHHMTINGESWRTIPIPGHNDDDIGLYNEQRGILLCGDLIHNSMTIWLGPPASDLSVYMDTLSSLLDLPRLDLILPAHGKPIHNPQKRIKQAIVHREKRTQQICKILEKKPDGQTFYQIFRKIYPFRALLKRNLFGGWIQVTLDDLCKKHIAESFVRRHTTWFRLK